MSKQFNEDGTYNKTDWKAGDKITATKLNKIEDAIEAVNDHDISRHQEADARLDALEAGVVANKQEIEAKVEALEDTVVSNKDAADLDIYRIDQHMTLLDKKIDDGVAEVYTVAETVDGKIAKAEADMDAAVADMDAAVAEADASMKAQVAEADAIVEQGKVDMAAMVEDVEDELEYNTNRINIFEDEKVNVRLFGAKGDGVTDDTEVIKNAINYALERSCDVYIPYGVYIISDTLEFRDLKLIGSKKRPKLKMITEKPIMHIHGSSEVYNFILQGCNYTKADCIGVNIGNETYTNNPFTIHNVYFDTGFYDCIYTNYECDVAKITQCVCYSTVGRSVIYIDTKESIPASANTIIEQCHFNSINGQHDNTTNKYGIYFNRGDNVSIRNNIVNNYDICVFIRNHWGINIQGLHMEERRNLIVDTEYWSGGKTVNPGDFIRPTKNNADGCIYIATVGGVTGDSEPSWNEGTLDNTVIWSRYKRSIGLSSSLIRHGVVKTVTPDNQIIAINAYSGEQTMSYEGIQHLGTCDYSFKDTSGAQSKFQFSNSSFSGNLKFVADPNAQASIQYCDSKNDNILGYTLDIKGTYYLRCNGHKGYTPKKQINDDYTVHFMSDSVLFVDTSDKNIVITIPDQNLIGCEHGHY